jgi:hypothetical protein
VKEARSTALITQCRVHIVATADPEPAQLAAWHRLWEHLLREGIPENVNAPRGKGEAINDGTEAGMDVLA